MFKPKVDAPAAEAPPKTAWDRLLTTTLVVMTVVATLLAGLSSSEMTRAQYFRSLAAQSQSKVGDQWAFFQAKRARGSTYGLTERLLRALSDADEFNPAALQASLGQFSNQVRLGEKNARDIVDRLNKTRPPGGADALRRAAEQLLELSRTTPAKLGDLKKRVANTLASPDVEKALALLRAGSLDGVVSEPGRGAGGDRPIQLALQEVGRRKTEQDTEAVVASVDERVLGDAIRDAEAQAKALDETVRPIRQALGQVDTLVREEQLLARKYSKAVAAVHDAWEPLSSDVQPEVGLSISSLVWSASRVNESTKELNNAYLAGSMRFEGWRYDREAVDNQRAAGLYEVQVRKHGWAAERHRRRSAYFFYGMLAAQAGVTIASLALAVKLRSLLWALASLAGLIAVCIAAYVYFYV